MNRYNLEEKLIGEGSFGVSKLILEEALDWINVAFSQLIVRTVFRATKKGNSARKVSDIGYKRERERSVIWK